MRRLTALALPSAMALLAAAAALHAGPAAAEPLPVVWDLAAAQANRLHVLADPNWAPPGANDPSCRLTPAHPNPVVLINPLFSTAEAFSADAPYLRNNGYCVFTFNYGNITPYPNVPSQSLAHARDSAQDIATEVDKVRARTGAARVDLLAWSYGAFAAAYYLNLLDGNRYVDKMIAIAPINHGTNVPGFDLEPLSTLLARTGADPIASTAPAIAEQRSESAVTQQIWANGDTRPGVTYTVIATRYDQGSNPYTRQFLHGPTVTDITVQDGCPADHSDHYSIAFNERTYRYALNALDPAHPVLIPCFPVEPTQGWVRAASVGDS
ncbi:esterase/lipase family protein [Nocardia transvalensis]|uniref:esterase/lipase family protein n=1 Tax=Nocardia transvalensis TaxID=37333 RepID=UPI001894BD15|nr:triacylglycerol lipase [Nocardia transvalensis]MBF6327251.1 triacylglycerol lipase [Nocardia transvalensis]